MSKNTPVAAAAKLANRTTLKGLKAILSKMDGGYTEQPHCAYLFGKGAQPSELVLLNDPIENPASFETGSVDASNWNGAMAILFVQGIEVGAELLRDGKTLATEDEAYSDMEQAAEVASALKTAGAKRVEIVDETVRPREEAPATPGRPELTVVRDEEEGAVPPSDPIADIKEDAHKKVSELAGALAPLFEDAKPEKKSKGGKKTKAAAADVTPKADDVAEHVIPPAGAATPEQSAASEAALPSPEIMSDEHRAKIERSLAEGLALLGLRSRGALMEYAVRVGLVSGKEGADKPERAARPEGVLDVLAKLCLRPEGCTQKEAHAALIKRFPERAPDSMLSTIRVQLGGKGEKAGARLAQDRKLKITACEEKGREGLVFRAVSA